MSAQIPGEKKRIEEGLELVIQYAKRGGFVPAVAQDSQSGEILMLAYANQTALEETLRSGYATFWKTSENRLWKKGEESGNRLKVVDVLTDCDQDALVYLVQRESGGACHTRDLTGNSRRSCFYRRIIGGKILEFKEGYR